LRLPKWQKADEMRNLSVRWEADLRENAVILTQCKLFPENNLCLFIEVEISLNSPAAGITENGWHTPGTLLAT
jgi:hypothetical protein